MGAVAGPSIVLQCMIAQEHDFTSMLNSIMDQRAIMAQASIFLGMQKAQVLQGSMNGSSPQNTAQMGIIEQKQKILEQMEKMLDMKKTQIETQLKACQQRRESLEKLLDKNIKSAFTFGGSGGG